ncbi:MAG: hypothetical protein ABI685_03710 [Ferruginibacter sp.]
MQKAKKILCCFIVVIIFFSIDVKAQTVENSINLYGTNFPQEKIHIHFDKESYLPGETIWFKAYLFEENLPSERSTNFYAALYDEKGRLLKQQISPVFSSSSDGYFVLPDSLQATQVICRAYTSWMLNFDTSMLFSKTIKINNNKGPAQDPASAKTVSLTFFPEGGNIIDGAVNTVAFKANYNNGLPFYFNGVIKKQETGEVIMPLTVLHDGMGKFDLDFKPGDKYYAEWIDNNGIKQQTWLPDAKATGVSLKLTVQKDKLYFNLVNKTGSDSLHVLMYMYQKVFYKTNLKVAATEPFTGMVPISTLPTGTMQLTVFDANWQPVAERVAFIKNNNFTINAALNTTEISTQKRGKNSIEILAGDTIPANMSLSISDSDMNSEASDNTIVSNFLLRGDIKGYIHNPAYYFTNNTDVALKNKLDLVMLTNGWRRYNWADMMVHKMPVIKYPADEYLGIYGQIGKEVMDKMPKDERVNLIIKTADSTNNFYSMRPDKAGFLKQTGLVFYDTARIYFSFNKNKTNNNQIAFSKYNFTYPALYAINNYKDMLQPDTSGMGFNPNTALFQYYVVNNGIKKFNEEKMMKTVVVKTNSRRSWQNDPLLKMDEKYTSGMFTAGATGYAVDVLHDEKAWTKFDFYNYLRSAMPSILIGGFNLTSGRSLTYNSKSVLVYIDEHEMTTNDLESLSLSQVAYIKLIPYFLGSGADQGGSGLMPALSIYTRKGDDLIDRRPKETDLGLIKIAGYSPIKEFYSPDYTQNNTNTGIDARTTLLWLPYIFTDAANQKVPITFYNNDFTKKMRIVLEGINDKGQMIHIEKIIE